MKKIIRVSQIDRSPLQFTWIMNNICTNACSYCPVDLHSGTNHNYEWENAKRFFNMLFERYSKIHCVISGGEPSLSPFFREIVEIFYKKGHTIGLTSNAAKPASFWAEVAPFFNYICFSWHPENPDPNFEEKILAASEHTLVSIRIMAHPDYWHQCVNMYYDLFKKHPHLSVESVRILPWNNDVEYIANMYTPEQIRWFETNPTQFRETTNSKFFKKLVMINPTYHFDDGTIASNVENAVDFINSGMTNFYGYKCMIGLKELFVNWRGQIALGNCDTENFIGHINEPEKIIWPTEPIICNKTLCHCTTSVNVPKWSLTDE